MKESASICIHEGNMMEAVWLTVDKDAEQLLIDVAVAIYVSGTMFPIEAPELVSTIFCQMRESRTGRYVKYGISPSPRPSISHCIIYVNTRERVVDFGVQRLTFTDIIESDSETLLRLYRIEDPPRVKAGREGTGEGTREGKGE
ncbi:MAG: hypothetical protein WC302_03335 [Candidatus Paceibacterota bacterium]|jgi:hypothetical protein